MIIATVVLTPRLLLHSFFVIRTIPRKMLFKDINIDIMLWNILDLGNCGDVEKTGTIMMISTIIIGFTICYSY